MNHRQDSHKKQALSTDLSNLDSLRPQFAMFNDEGDSGAIDEPVKDFPLTHFLKLGEDV